MAVVALGGDEVLGAGLGRALLAPGLGGGQRVAHRGAQAAQAALDQVVVHPALHGLHRGFLAQQAGNEFGYRINDALTNGTGTVQPRGMVVAASAGVTGGTATAFTLTPAPAITANAANQRFRVKFNAAAGTTPTLAVSGQAALALKYRDSTGAKQAITATQVPINWVSDVENDGTDWVVLDSLPAVAVSPASVQGAFKNLAASATGTSANVTVSADEIVVENSSNIYQTLRAVSLTIAGTSVGANALDTGTIAASTWYSVWVIWNGTTTAGLLSLSATAPTLPGGYTHKARIGWIRTDGTGNKFPLKFVQNGRKVQYSVAAGSNLTALPIMSSGAQGSITTPTWVAVATGNFIPSTAGEIDVVLAGQYSSGSAYQGIVAPNNGYGGITSSTNPPPLAINNLGAGSATGTATKMSMVPESSNIYAALSPGSGTIEVLCAGWTDNF